MKYENEIFFDSPCIRGTKLLASSSPFIFSAPELHVHVHYYFYHLTFRIVSLEIAVVGYPKIERHSKAGL